MSNQPAGDTVRRSNEPIIRDLNAYAVEYNDLKTRGLYPSEIAALMSKKYGFKHPTHYKYIRRCRIAGLVTDTHEENNKRGTAARRQWLLANNGKIKGKQFYFVERAIPIKVSIKSSNRLERMARTIADRYNKIMKPRKS